MARVLVMTSGLTAITLAALEVVRRLEAAGHEVTFASPHGVRALVEANGVRYEQLSPVSWDPAPQVEGGGRAWRKVREVATRRERVRVGVEALGMASFGAWLDERRPDLVIADLEMDEHIMTLLARGTRMALLSPWFEHVERAGLPPLGSRVVPGEGVAGSEGALRAAWAEVRRERRRRRGDVWLRYLGTDRRGVLKAYGRSLGLRDRLGRGEDWVTHFDYPGVPVFTMTPAEFEFEHGWRTERTAVGPMVRLDRREPGGSEEARAALEAAVAAARAAGRRVLYASGSSKVSGDVEFLGRVASALRSVGGAALVVGMGGDVEGAARLRGALGEDAHVLDWAPQLEALRTADAALNHGGIGSILEAATLGTPMVVASDHVADQDGCAARIAHHDAGVVIDKEDAREEGLAQALRAALEDEHRARRAAEVAAVCARYSDERVLEAAVEGLIRSRR